jgi:hypothetical protein
MGSQIAQVLQNITSWARYIGVALVALIALGLTVAAFGRAQGSITRVLTIVGCALLASALIWQLPDLLKLATTDAPSITGVGSRY